MQANQSIKINILTFNPPITEKQFSFITERKQNFFPIKNDEFPLNIDKIISDKEIEKTQYLYTDFSENHSDLKLNVDLTKSKRFANHYYSYILYQYFNKVADAVQFDFVNDLLVWLKNENESNEQTSVYNIFRLRVQHNRVSEYPELLIAYHVQSTVSNKSIAEIDNIDTVIYSRIIYNKTIYNFKFLPDDARYEYEKVYPVLNNRLKAEFSEDDNAEIEKNTFDPTRNKYKEHFSLLNSFLYDYILTDEFKEIIPLNSDNWIDFNSDIFHTSPDSNRMVFGRNTTNISPKKGIWKGVYKQPDAKQTIDFLFIYHSSQRNKVI